MTRQKEVEDFLRAHPGSTLRDILQATNMSRRTAYAALKALSSDGTVQKHPHLRDTRMHRYYHKETTAHARTA